MDKLVDIKLTTEEYADLRAVTVRYVRKLCEKGKLKSIEVRGTSGGGNGGVSYLIPLTSLTDKEIRRYLRQHNKEDLIKKQPQNIEEKEDVDFEELSLQQREELNLKNKILDGWIDYRESEKNNGKRYEEADDEYIRIISLQYPDIRISKRTIYRWEKARRKYGELALIDTRGRHDNHATKISKEVFDIFEYYYLDESRKSAELCRHLTELELKKRGTEAYIPTVRTLIRKIKDIPPAVLMYYRFGAKACKDKCLPYIHREYEDLYSNDIWVCDNHTFDIIVHENEKPLRVYLTAFLDVKSRKMMSHYVTLTPSSDSTLYALRRGIERYGIPKRIYSDNGREFLTFDIGGRGFRKHSKNAELDPTTIMDRLGIEFKTALVKNARAKIIERTFLTVKNEFSKLFTAYTGGSISERPERLKLIEKDISKLTVLQDFEGFVEQYIEGCYNYRNHSGLGMRGMTPNEVYAKNLVEKRVASAEVLNIMLMRSTRLQKVTRAGVKLNFYDQEIWFTNEELIMNYQGERVYVRFDPRNLESVRVYDSEDRYMLTALQDKKLGYFASKEELAVKMKELRHYEGIVKAYKKAKNIKATKSLNLILEEAQENLLREEKLDPEIIRIMRSPDAEFNELCIREATNGSIIDLDWGKANKNIRERKKRQDE